MRLKEVEIEAFRGFNRTVVLDFDADVVVLYGRNGFGKSSVFDAISWCLFGSSTRFGGTRDYSRAEARYLTNAFRSRGEERSKITFTTDDGDIIAERIGNDFYLYSQSDVMNGGPAEREILRMLGFQARNDQSTAALQRRARDSFTRSFMLHQDQLSAFLTSEKPRDRFNAFAELFALTPIKEFYVHLATEQSQATDQADGLRRQHDVESAALRQVERQLGAENDRLGELLRETESGSIRRLVLDRLRTLIDEVSNVVGNIEWTEDDLLRTIDEGTMRLSTKLSETERDLSTLRVLRDRARLLSSWSDELQRVTLLISEKEAGVGGAKREVEAVSEQIKSLRSKLDETGHEIALAEAEAQRLQALLADAIEAISIDACPICERPIPRDTLIAQLRNRLGSADPHVGEVTTRRKTITDELRLKQSDAQAHTLGLRNLEKDVENLRTQRANLQRQINEVRSGLEERLGTVEVPDSQVEEALGVQITQTEGLLKRLGEMADDLRSVRPTLEVLRTRRQLERLEEEAKQQRSKVDALAKRGAAYSQASGMLGDLVGAARRAERRVVESFIRRFKDPIQEAYRWLAPHPLFDKLDFEFDEFDQAGELYFSVSDGATHLNPSTTFSSAQANALALSVFLALNAGQQWSPLTATLIDDPIQNQDDVNVLSLIDLLRNSSRDRQLVISTSVSHLQRLFLDKLRPTMEGKRLVAHTFNSLLPEGPDIRREVVEFIPGRSVLQDLERMSAA
jgi:DNA repair exonuclease SbcCD ATPase subunit